MAAALWNRGAPGSGVRKLRFANVEGDAARRAADLVFKRFALRFDAMHERLKGFGSLDAELTDLE